VLQNTSHHGFLHLKLQKKHSGLSPAQFLPLIWLAHNPITFSIFERVLIGQVQCLFLSTLIPIPFKDMAALVPNVVVLQDTMN
jgi:hypothetical protein